MGILAGRTFKGARRARWDSPNNGQEPKGRFTKGNKASRGNAFARRVAGCLPSRWTRDGRGYARSCGSCSLTKAGDAAAAKLLLAYGIGLPTEAVNPDRVELEEFRLLKECPTPARVRQLLLDGLPPATVVDLVQEHFPDTRIARLDWLGRDRYRRSEVTGFPSRHIRAGGHLPLVWPAPEPKGCPKRGSCSRRTPRPTVLHRD